MEDTCPVVLPPQDGMTTHTSWGRTNGKLKVYSYVALQVQQLKQKWDAIDGLKAQAEQQAQQVAKLEADVAKLQADLDELPGESAASTQGSQAAPSEEIQALKKQVADLNTEVGPQFIFNFKETNAECQL